MSKIGFQKYPLTKSKKTDKKFSLIICTYNRPEAVVNLLNSVINQKIIPSEILIIDGSESNSTLEFIKTSNIKDIKYFKVKESDRGLTLQRNFGVKKMSPKSEIVFFLDDDVVLQFDYFSQILKTYEKYPEALGVSGYITNEVVWKTATDNYRCGKNEYFYDGWVRAEGFRFGLRRRFGLAPDKPPGIMPDFFHGYSTGFLPPSGRIYEVELLMGGLASYRTEVLKKLKFSTFFKGYGLYEDADFSLRVSKMGKLYVNTAARLEHHHDPAGRPNMFHYGKMVIRNGWYVWRLKYPKSTFRARMKWHATSFLLTLVRIGNIITTKEKKKALTESLGRISGWISLIFNKPAHEHEKS